MDTSKIARWFMFSLIGIIVIFLVFIGGYYAGAKLGGSTYVKGWEDAKKQIEKSGVFADTENPIFNISGRITSVLGKTITIEANKISTNPLAKQAPTQRTITMADGGTIVYQKQKTAQEYAAEQTEYFKKVKEGKEQNLQPPTPFIEKTITIGELKVNDYITIIANQNIRYEKNVAADKILKVDIQ